MIDGSLRQFYVRTQLFLASLLLADVADVLTNEQTTSPTQEETVGKISSAASTIDGNTHLRRLVAVVR